MTSSVSYPQNPRKIPVITGHRIDVTTVFTNNRSSAKKPFLCPTLSSCFCPATSAILRMCWSTKSDHAAQSSSLSLSTFPLEDTITDSQSTGRSCSTTSARQCRKPRHSAHATTLTELPKATSGGTWNRPRSNSCIDESDLLSCYTVNARSLKKANALPLLQTELM